ncbi:MAG: hypothetical protein ACKVY0_25610 [Prosthecobacter sp.]|uniref:hypothetical protein n=1 Tax=Prosthecobacter sp. TaxID=1965333 RepID=UPI0039029D48
MKPIPLLLTALLLAPLAAKSADKPNTKVPDPQWLVCVDHTRISESCNRSGRGGKQLVITSDDASDQNQIQQVKRDGVIRPETWVTASDISKCGQLAFKLGSGSSSWAKIHQRLDESFSVKAHEQRRQQDEEYMSGKPKPHGSHDDQQASERRGRKPSQDKIDQAHVHELVLAEGFDLSQCACARTEGFRKTAYARLN